MPVGPEHGICRIVRDVDRFEELYGAWAPSVDLGAPTTTFVQGGLTDR